MAIVTVGIDQLKPAQPIAWATAMRRDHEHLDIRGCAPRRCGRLCAGATDAGTGAAGVGRDGGGAEKADSLRL